VFLSGGGRTLRNLIAAIDRGELPASIATVIASRECGGGDIARDNGIPTRVIRGAPAPDVITELFTSGTADWIVLAGYLRMVPIVPQAEGRIVNIHPALLPSFGGPGMYGERVHRAVLESGVCETGCTVHLCDGRYDTGPIIAQARCPVCVGDTPESLGARVFELECELYPRALAELIAGVGASR
jgi:phosphoribosylglycinamide formyltransferase-1